MPGHTAELCEAMNNELNAKWQKLRGLEIVSIGIKSINAPKEDEDMIKELQRTAVFRNPNMAGAAMVGAQADAMKAAASNSGGVMAGFMGVNMAQQSGGLAYAERSIMENSVQNAVRQSLLKADGHVHAEM